MDQKLIQLAIRLYEKLQSGNAVAKRLDVSPSTAYRLLNAGGVDLPDRHGPEIQDRKKKLQGKLAASAAADYAGGMSADELIAKYCCSIWAIRTAAKDAGVDLRSIGGRFRVFNTEDADEAAELYRSGWSQQKIAAKFGAHQVTVGRLLRDRGEITYRKLE